MRNIPQKQKQRHENADMILAFDHNSAAILEADEKGLSPWLEQLYQMIASEAMSHYPDSEVLEQEFERLLHSLTSAEVASPKDEESITSGTSCMQTLHEDETEDWTRELMGKRKTHSFSRSDLFRQPVKERRRIFESHNNSNDGQVTGPVRKFLRVDSVKAKKQFFEQSCSTHRDRDRENETTMSPKRKSTVSLTDRRSFWESFSNPEETTQTLTPASVSSSRTVTESVTPVVPLASPEPSLSDSGRNSQTESRPECDQVPQEADCHDMDMVLERSIVTPATTGYDNISLSDVYCAVDSYDPHSSAGAANTRSHSASHDDGNDFIYDEYEEQFEFETQRMDGKQNVGKDTESSFQLNSRLGRMFGINPEKAEAVGSALYHGLVDVENKFTVTTRGAGTGFLTVGIQGAAGTAQTITQTALDDWTFEVSYRVPRPGYYVIFVRWGDCYIRDSPFVCHVSNPAAIM